jgi:hypothetical protein
MSHRLLVPSLLIAALAAGCGSSNHTAAAPPPAGTTTNGTTTATSPGTTTGAAGPGALEAEANAAAAGDIPDNQVFIVFRNPAAGYSMKYPEGWAQQGSAGRVDFRDKNNIVRVVVASGGAATAASVRAQVARLPGATIRSAAQTLSVSGRPAVKVVYSTRSAPNAVTGKRVNLVVDRYYLWNGGRRAVVDLGTPEGVDNVDAYRLMIESFRWH